MKAKKLLLFIACSLSLTANQAFSETFTLQDITHDVTPLPKTTIYVAKEVVTLDPNKPSTRAIAVVDDRILATGSLKKLKAAIQGQPYRVDRTFADKVIVPGFIAQHDHPLLTALTMTSEIIAIEDWVLPSGTVKAAKNHKQYMERLRTAESQRENPDEVFLTWGYHHLFHGKVTRADLNEINPNRPIVVWHRSAHEFILNSKALEKAGIDEALIAGLPDAAQEQINFEEGHFWEAGMFAIISNLLPTITTPERFREGLEFTEQYYHANGVTLGSEPGGIYSEQVQNSINEVFSDLETPFRYYFIPDGKSIYATHPDTTIAQTEETLDWGRGMTSMMPKRIKLFADGAIYSQLMQLREPYLDGHHGEWIVPLEDFANAFRIYWDAGYQIHVHVNGDAGVDMVLDNVEENMRRKPRHDHRTLLAHLAVSQKDQVKRMRRLGVIVSGNPYYVTILADKYSKKGLGPKRANNMVRMGDIERAGISHSYHSDMPMAPAQPLFLMHTAVNRTTVSGRVAAPHQRSSREAALKAVTLEAAYSLGLEDEVGSIVPGKLANFTVLADNPVTISADKIKDIEVWGTVHEGRKLPVQQQQIAKRTAQGPVPNAATFKVMDLEAFAHAHSHGEEGKAHSDICMLNKVFATAMIQSQ